MTKWERIFFDLLFSGDLQNILWDDAFAFFKKTKKQQVSIITCLRWFWNFWAGNRFHILSLSFSYNLLPHFQHTTNALCNEIQMRNKLLINAKQTAERRRAKTDGALTRRYIFFECEHFTGLKSNPIFIFNRAEHEFLTYFTLYLRDCPGGTSYNQCVNTVNECFQTSREMTPAKRLLEAFPPTYLPLNSSGMCYLICDVLYSNVKALTSFI